MTDDRPPPQYGEYATPEQQAAAMGKRYVAPPAAETRVIVPGVPAPGVVSEEGERPSLRLGGNLIDRFVTIFQLGIGLVFLLSSDYFRLSEDANSGMEELGFTQKISVTIDQYGWVILAVNIVLLFLTFAWAFAWLRRGRLAFYIPFVGYLAFVAFLGIVISSVG
jgi:hypothetical protein